MLVSPDAVGRLQTAKASTGVTMELVEIQKGDVVIMEPRGRMDTAGAKPFGDRVAELIGAGSHHLLIDMTDIVYISSAGFRALLVAHKLIDDCRGKLVLCGVSPELRRLFKIGRFLNLFTVCATRDEGIAQAS